MCRPGFAQSSDHTEHFPRDLDGLSKARKAAEGMHSGGRIRFSASLYVFLCPALKIMMQPSCKHGCLITGRLCICHDVGYIFIIAKPRDEIHPKCAASKIVLQRWPGWCRQKRTAMLSNGFSKGYNGNKLETDYVRKKDIEDDGEREVGF